MLSNDFLFCKKLLITTNITWLLTKVYFIEYFIKGNQRYALYSLNKFYVEVEYDVTANKNQTWKFGNKISFQLLVLLIMQILLYIYFNYTNVFFKYDKTNNILTKF